MVRRRLQLLMLLLSVPYLAIAARLATLQLFEQTRQHYEQLALHKSSRLLAPRRGRIFSRNGKVLAANEPVFRLLFNVNLLNPRTKPLRILVEALGEDRDGSGEKGLSGFPSCDVVERRMLELVDAALESAAFSPELLGIPGSGGGARPSLASSGRSDLVFLVGNIGRRQGEIVKWRLRRYTDIFEVVPEDAADGWQVWFHARKALQMETTLLRLAARCAPPGETDAVFEKLRADVAGQMERIAKLVQNEVEAFRRRREGASAAEVAAKRRDALEAYHRDWWSPLLDDVSVDVITDIEYHAREYPGIRVEHDSRRVYPQGALCSALVGQLRPLRGGEPAAQREMLLRLRGLSTADFEAARRDAACLQELTGASGLEAFYDRELRGLYGRRTVSRDNRGKPRKTLEEIPSRDGADIRTTLDTELQELLYDALRSTFDGAGVNKGARGAAAAVMELPSGALLASVGFPAADPQKPQSEAYADELRRRWPGTDGFFLDRPCRSRLYPGSVFKIVMAAAAMESGRSPKGRYSPKVRLHCAHEFRDPEFPGVRGLHCASSRGHNLPDLDLVQAIERSCNSYFYFLGLHYLDAATIRRWALAFGYGRPTGIDLPEPSAARLCRLDGAEKVRSKKSLCYYSIGQVHVEATPLQVLRSVAAIASGGRTVPRPHLVRPTAPPDVLPLQDTHTVELIREGMWRVVHEAGGTASRTTLGLAQFSVALKTGTAEVASRGGGQILHQGWLVGFAPYGKPRVAFVVVVDRTRAHGADACAPIVEKLLKHLAAGAADAYSAAAEEGPGQEL